MGDSVLGSPVLADCLLLPRNSKRRGPQPAQSPTGVLPTPTTLTYTQIPLCWLLSIPQDLSLIPLLTSTERIFPKAKKKGCMLMSGSLRKQLGLAWCWKCMWFHQLAGAP